MLSCLSILLPYPSLKLKNLTLYSERQSALTCTEKKVIRLLGKKRTQIICHSQ